MAGARLLLRFVLWWRHLAWLARADGGLGVVDVSSVAHWFLFMGRRGF